MAQFRSKPFGVTKNGDKVDEYIISNPGGLEISVLNYGCVIKNLFVPTKTGPVDVVVGHDTLADYEADFNSSGSTCCGAFVGRYANRIENAEFSLSGKTYKLEANNGKNHLHGTFPRKIYDVKMFGDTLLMETESQQLTMISLMGFIVLMGTVVNNGIVFVDYANQLRLGGLERRAALVATGKTRMRPILMTTLTTVLAMLQMVFSNDMASQLMSGMAIVIICGLSYATLMTLYIVPVLYDVMFRKPPLNVDVGSDDDLDDIPDDAAEFIAAQKSAGTAQPEA